MPIRRPMTCFELEDASGCGNLGLCSLDLVSPLTLRIPVTQLVMFLSNLGLLGDGMALVLTSLGPDFSFHRRRASQMAQPDSVTGRRNSLGSRRVQRPDFDLHDLWYLGSEGFCPAVRS